MSVRPARLAPNRRAHSPWRDARAAAAGSPLGQVVGALRRGREAVEEIDGQLDEVLDYLGDPDKKALPQDLPDRMKRSKQRAEAALLGIGGPAGNDIY